MDVFVLLPIWLLASGVIVAIYLAVAFSKGSSTMHSGSGIVPPPLNYGSTRPEDGRVL